MTRKRRRFTASFKKRLALEGAGRARRFAFHLENHEGVHTRAASVVAQPIWRGS
ncbi:MAG: hypothetical protein OXG82_06055 [Gammaproteobacteria bacterium]|nr:hypothetical protein [Gammaproteobacteria bacterium]